jgi:hypothetical protein
LADAYCITCHKFVPPATSMADRHEHQPLMAVQFGKEPTGHDDRTILEAMRDHRGWWSTWDLVPLTNSVNVRDNIRSLKKLGWCFDEDWRTENGKRHKVWRLILPTQDQGGLF